MTARLRRRYGRVSGGWSRVDGGYEKTVDGPSHPVTYRVQRRRDLSDRQKWQLDQRLGLKRRDGKRREAWVVLIGDYPLDHAYGKKEAIALGESEAAETVAAARPRASSGPMLGIGITQQQAYVLPERRRVDVEPRTREDMRVLAEHLPELRGRRS